jgi:hypothetical protein
MGLRTPEELDKKGERLTARLREKKETLTPEKSRELKKRVKRAFRRASLLRASAQREEQRKVKKEKKAAS